MSLLNYQIPFCERLVFLWMNQRPGPVSRNVDMLPLQAQAFCRLTGPRRCGARNLKIAALGQFVVCSCQATRSRVAHRRAAFRAVWLLWSNCKLLLVWRVSRSSLRSEHRAIESFRIKLSCLVDMSSLSSAHVRLWHPKLLQGLQGCSAFSAKGTHPRFASACPPVAASFEGLGSTLYC